MANVSENFIMCPHCHYEDKHWHEYVDPVDMEADFTMDCPYCKEKIRIQMTTKVYFRTTKVGK